MVLFADVRGPQDTHSLGICRHDSVFNAVVDHFDKMAGAVRTAAEVAEFGGGTEFLTTRSSWNRTDTRRECGEDRIEMFHHRWFAANHHAIAALQTPDPTARSDVNVVNIFLGQFFGSPDVFHIIRIATINK